MVNATYTPTSSDLIVTGADGTEYLYNNGDIAFSE